MDPGLRVVKVRQLWPDTALDDVDGHVRGLLRGPEAQESLRQLAASDRGRPKTTSSLLDIALPPGADGPRVAVTAGSRGIRDLALVLRTVIDELRRTGCRPFVVPCMGSHGGATPQGQVDVLADLGVTEASVGAPLVSSLDVVEVATSAFGAPVYVGRDLVAADGIVAVNRVKVHTDFSADIGSGIAKMLVIGAGKQQGAESAHRSCLQHGYPETIVEHARCIVERLPVLFGIAVVEEQRERTAAVELVPTLQGIEVLLTRERALKVKADSLMARLPFNDIDVLVVDRMGKEISGAGVDTNVVGRRAIRAGTQPSCPHVRRLLICDLTDQSHGNASGVGVADFITRRLLDKVDRRYTEINCLTAAAPEEARLPIALDTDREAVAACLSTCGVQHAADARLVWIRDTMSLETLVVSEALLPEVRASADTLTTEGELSALPFTIAGELVSPW